LPEKKVEIVRLALYPILKLKLLKTSDVLESSWQSRRWCQEICFTLISETGEGAGEHEIIEIESQTKTFYALFNPTASSSPKRK
jgi:hypothetical protein